MKRRLFTVVAALSCLLAAGVAASWARSYWVYDQVSCSPVPDRYQCAWRSYGASFQFSSWPPGIPKGASGAVLTCFGKFLLDTGLWCCFSPYFHQRGCLRRVGEPFGMRWIRHKARGEEQPPNKGMRATAYGG